MSDLQATVDALLKKAADAHDSTDAVRYSQAALNAAHTKDALGTRAPAAYLGGTGGGGGTRA